LQSQLDTLEPLEPDEHGLVVDVAGSLDDVLAAARAALADQDGAPR
jgi:gluconokinase